MSPRSREIVYEAFDSINFYDADLMKVFKKHKVLKKIQSKSAINKKGVSLKDMQSK
eukprot:CAMPEP_0116884036 /NCGR_PEP_ID=MMETSP0463-20121206/16753_1 /TAXON_ID=181622 /ORGANISM="Strombidinopsis sp, Strain SopsisLIS2011" /LENGTH=55 /DNA_ID=CAMNT_0004539789 /DNA_START=533 /DNA_END=700 /DNA_ORIENTATION=-